MKRAHTALALIRMLEITRKQRTVDASEADRITADFGRGPVTMRPIREGERIDPEREYATGDGRRWTPDELRELLDKGKPE